MKFTDKQFKHSNAMSLSFRNPISHKADRIAELDEENCDEMFD